MKGGEKMKTKKGMSDIMFGIIVIVILIGVISILFSIFLNIHINGLNEDIDELTSTLKKVKNQVYNLDSDLFGYGLHTEDAHYILIDFKNELKENREKDIVYQNKVVMEIKELKELLIKRTASLWLYMYDIKHDWLLPIYNGCVKNKR